jgi:CHAT domain-containing protein
VGSPAYELATTALERVGSDPATAVTDADRALVAARRAGDREAESVGHRARCLGLRELGQIDAALASGRAAVRTAVRTGDGNLEAEARMSLAFVLLERGAVAASLRQADRAASTARGLIAARVTAQRGLILSRTGRYDDSLAAYARALPGLRRAHDEVWEARLRNNRGLLRAYHGALTDAESDLRRALELHETAGAHLLAAGSRWNLGFVAARRGDAPGALVQYDAAAETYRSQQVPALELLIDRSELLLSVGASAEARRTAARAVAELRSSALGLHLPEALLLLAQATLADGEPAPAHDAAVEAARLFTGQGRSHWAVLARYVGIRADERQGDPGRGLLRESLQVADALHSARWMVHELDMRLTAARAAIALGEHELAAEQLQIASRARRAGPLAVRMRAWYAEALLRLEAGETVRAERALRAGMDLLARQRVTLGATELRMHVAGHGRDVAGLGLRLAAEAGSSRRVLAWAERWRAGTLRLRPVLPPGRGQLAADLAALRRATAEAEQARLDGAPTRALDREVAQWEAQVRAHSRRAGAGGVWAVAGTQVRAARTYADALQGAVLVELVEVGDELLAVTVTARRVRLHRLGPAAVAGQHADAIAFALRRLATAHNAAVLDRSVRSLHAGAAALDAAVLGPLAHELGDRPLVVVPTGGLQSVPWSLLPRATGRPVTVSPSAELWLDSQARRHGHRPVALVAAAGPRLPAAVREVHEVAAVRDAQVLTGEDASAAAVLAAMGRADTVHVAAHGRLRVDNPMFSSLELADGPLTIYDLEHVRQAPRVVVLPACQSGQPDVRAGDEVMGLAQALLAVGAGAVVATVLPVDDEATRPLMVDLHRHLAAGAPVATALVSAQSGQDDGDPRSVAAAAAFVCFGAGLLAPPVSAAGPPAP